MRMIQYSSAVEWAKARLRRAHRPGGSLSWWARGACHRARIRATRWLCPPYASAGLLPWLRQAEAGERLFGEREGLVVNLGALDEIVEIAGGGFRLDLDELDLLEFFARDHADLDQVVDALQGVDLGLVADREPHLALPVLHLEPVGGRLAVPAVGQRPRDEDAVEIVQLGDDAGAVIGAVHLPAGDVRKTIERQP